MGKKHASQYVNFGWLHRCKISANEMIDLINKKLFDSDNL